MSIFGFPIQLFGQFLVSFEFLLLSSNSAFDTEKEMCLYYIIRRQNEHSSSRAQQTQTCLIIRITLNGQEQVIFFGTT